MNDNKRINTKIGVGSVVKAKSREMEDSTREGISRRNRKYVVGRVQDVIRKNNFLVQFEDRHNKDISSVLISYVSSKYDLCLEIYEPISDLHPKQQGELLTIDGDPVVKEGTMFERGTYLSGFYCLCVF